jgi:hypothetical protein
MTKLYNLSGQIINNISVLELIGLDIHNSKVWKCKCNCGTEINLSSKQLQYNKYLSCRECAIKAGHKPLNPATLKSYNSSRIHNTKSKMPNELHITPEQKQLILDRFLSGTCISKISQLIGCSRGVINNKLSESIRELIQENKNLKDSLIQTQISSNLPQTNNTVIELETKIKELESKLNSMSEYNRVLESNLDTKDKLLTLTKEDNNQVSQILLTKLGLM